MTVTHEVYRIETGDGAGISIPLYMDEVKPARRRSASTGRLKRSNFVVEDPLLNYKDAPGGSKHRYSSSEKESEPI